MKKKYSLKRNEEIAKIVHKRRFVKNEAFVMYYQPNSEVGHTRICISVSKKHGNSVVRNKLKRWVREAYKDLEEKLENGYKIIVLYKKNIDVAIIDFHVVKSELENCLNGAEIYRHE